MAVVALIPTGKMEHLALASSLKRLFPEHTFVVRPAEVHLDGFTSTDLGRFSTGRQIDIPTTLQELVETLVNAIFPGRRSERIDFAYVLEDLELCNQEHPETVLSLFRNAVEDYFDELGARTTTEPNWLIRQQNEVRSRCSFHLFRPMTEAYFFGDAGALTRAGVMRTAVLPSDIDLELFRTHDPDYLALPPRVSLPDWAQQLIKDPPQREQHPKSYMQFLCDPETTNKKARYREVNQGCAALESLNWEAVVGHPSRCPFLTAFLDDLSQALGCDVPFINPENADARVRIGPSKRVLRNL